ncbi:3-hydroxyacyl-CoA dehydrogenase, putative [Talaromyces islandicus]|uniref:3-hydroxyacyl-CoA dehydrogenase, putative n=1 Tax=Talaromyces islandicus TaxID=28573 RepID=A0A0U1M336_TALIS|nr:3-hydroxyacyl-CoA dehydrogenase, putative [Talaromyces islandicus]
MSLVIPNQTLITSTLKDLVVVLTGGAQGVGRSVVEQLHVAGAKVIFGDVDDNLAQQVISSLTTTNTTGKVHFVHCDISSYPDQLSLFQTAYNYYQRIDIVIANAAVSLSRDPFAPASLTDEAILTAPTMAEVDINLKGVLYTARLGYHYLRKNSESEHRGDLVLVSSIAGFKECEGLVSYTASKHGVIGVMRGLALQAAKEGVKVNTVCPWMTRTRMVKGIEQGWYDLNLPSNGPADVAQAILICSTANRSSSSSQQHQGAVLPFSGKILWVGGGKSYEIEDRLQSLEPEWLGYENSEILKRGQEYLHSAGTSWDNK